MFRASLDRSFAAGLKSSPTSRFASSALRNQLVTSRSGQTSQLCTLVPRRTQLAAQRPIPALILRSKYATSGFHGQDPEHEKEVGKKKIIPHPDLVSSSSSMHGVFSEIGDKDKKPDVKMSAGIVGDLYTIKETFSLTEVPRGGLVLGLAGLLPYLGTSLATVVCSYEINIAHEQGTGYLFTEAEAHRVLELLEPVQIGYGAVIISFLGAIHWGFEWAKYGGVQGYPRYMIGVLAPAAGWATMLLPHTSALIAQFLAFNMLYYVDARATRRGWVPPWYSTYRFVLTFIVGASIVVSLIGHGEIAHKDSNMPKASQKLGGLHEEYEESLKQQEAAHTALLKKQGKDKGAPPKEEDEDEEEEEEDSEAGDESDEKSEDDSGDDKEDSDDDSDDKK